MMGLNMEEEAEEILMTGGKIELILRKCLWFIWAEQSPTLQTYFMNGSCEQNNLLPYRHIWWILKLGSAWISVSLVCLEIHQTCHWCDQISCGFSEWVCKHKVQVNVCSELQSMQVYNCIRENEDISQTCCNKSLSGLNKYDVVTLRLWLRYLIQTYLTDSQKHLLSEISGHQLLCEGYGLWCGCRLYNFLSSKQPRFYLSNIILKDKCLCLEAHFFANKKGILYKNDKCKDQSLCVVFHRREPQVQIIWS